MLAIKQATEPALAKYDTQPATSAATIASAWDEISPEVLH